MTSRSAEIEKFAPLAPGIPGADAIEAYQRDGVVCLRNAFNDEWVEKGRRAVGTALRARFADKSWECNSDERGENLLHGGTLECTTFPRIC